MAVWAGPGDDTDEEIRLCRIEYLGDDDRGFALYDPERAGDRDPWDYPWRPCWRQPRSA